jgi:hypothetical protein
MEERRPLEKYPEAVWTGDGEHTPDEYLEKFLEELEDTRDRFDWRLVPDFGKNPDIRTIPRYRLRAIVEDGPAGGKTFEPIGAVCFVRTGSAFTEDHWSEAARTLGLPSLCVADLIAAANDHTWSGPGGDRKPVEHLQALRLRLLRAVGLRIRPSAVERVVDALIPGTRQTIVNP